MKYILTIIIISLLVACDGPYNNCPEYYFSDHYKSYTNFNKNSYWIYRDTSFDKIDSMVILSQNIRFNDNCDYNTNSEEILEQHFSSSFYDKNSSELEILGNATMNEYNSGFEIPTGYFIDNTQVIGQANFIDSLEINGFWYKNVRFFKSGKYESYWAKNIGLIKKVFPYPWDSDSIYHFNITKFHLE
jgi:hypothetical protein